MFNAMKHVLFYIFSAMILGQIPLSYAESVKLVQWWDEYLPQKFESNASMGYSIKTQSQQYQDVDGDGDTEELIVTTESLHEHMGPEGMMGHDHMMMGG